MYTLINLPDCPVGKGKTGDVPHMLVFNGMCPSYPPNMWGSDRDDSDRPGHQLVIYASLSPHVIKQLKGEIPMTNGVKLLQSFCRNYSKFVVITSILTPHNLKFHPTFLADDIDMLNRMKLIPIVANPEHSLAKVGYASKSVLKT